MTLPNELTPLLGSSTGYQISRSLRFNSADSAYLNRTPSAAGNRRIWTWSAWVKRTDIASTDVFLFSAQNGGGYYSLWSFIGFNNNQLRFYEEVLAISVTYEVRTTAVFRDPSAWYHFVVAVDTTQATAANRVKMYVNGVEITSFSASSYPSQNFEPQMGNTVSHDICSYVYNNNRGYSSTYLAEIHYVNGQQLTPSSFGEFDANNVWQPKAYTGTYGTNGFHLDFADNSAATAAALGKDTSGLGNNWTPNNLAVLQGNGNYVSGLPTNTSTSRLNAFDGSLTSRAEYNPGANIPVTWTAPSAITFTNSLGGVEVYVVAGTSATWFYRLNGGTEYSQSPEGWMKISTGNGTISSISFRNNLASNVALAAVRVNGTLLIDNSIDNDSLVDSPSSPAGQTDSGAGGTVVGNYCTWNPLAVGSPSDLAPSNGNLDATGFSVSGNRNKSIVSTTGVSSGKWYWEVSVTSVTGNLTAVTIGISSKSDPGELSFYPGYNAFGWSYYAANGTKNNVSQVSYGASYTAGDTIGVAFDADNGSLTFYKNGVSQGVAYSGLAAGTYYPAIGHGGSL
ncbi:MAG: hypothetical protein FJ077_14800, partial [Cyanobacteria bacterium K_DeepCast_35m_m2_023]|nr:hypothetical protein [Cyanobacteria bacterium K_DeepCast_35m_m2_023]